jgi:multiple sugar transport system ATP-binding protein
MIAGLETISEGELFIDGQLVNRVPSKDRDIAMVFQNYALYPHMTVYENMAFSLRMRKFPRAEIESRVRQAAEILGLNDFLERRPKALSGGQRQRVAVGRAIVRRPKLFLFDEPLSNLDAKLRVSMRAELIKLHKQLRATMIYVTHDQVEAMTLADRVVVMNRGRIEQEGPPNYLYHSPKTRFVAGFIGSPAMNFLPGRMEQSGNSLGIRVANDIVFPIPAGKAERYRPYQQTPSLILGLRPEHLTEFRDRLPPNYVEFDAIVDVVEPMGMETFVYFQVGGQQICGRLNPDVPTRIGEPMRLVADISNMHLIETESGRVI